MKNIYLILTLWTFCLIQSYGQNPFIITPTNTGCHHNNGMIKIFIEQSSFASLLSDYPLPYPIELTNVDTQADSYSLLNSQTLTIENLKAGTYTGVIWLDEDAGCKYPFEVTIGSPEPITFAQNLELSLPTSCTSEDGWISTWRYGIINGGLRPLTYFKVNISTI